MALPKPHSLKAQDTGMPQMRRRSGVRTASGNVQEAFLERVRAVRDDPMLVFPDLVGDEPRAMAKLRGQLEDCKAGRLGFFAKRDKGLVGAVWSCRELAERQAAPRLMDARVEGDRRFYLPVGHVSKPACLGVQNWDEPAALLLAYQEFADGGLFFFAEPDLWCSGDRPIFPPQWVAALGSRVGAELALRGDDAACPHGDRAVLAHVLPGGASIRLCGECWTPEVPAAIAARMLNPGGRRPYTLEVVLPDRTRKPASRSEDALYRVGQATGATLVDAALAGWHGTLAGRFAIADRLFADQDAFLDAVEAPAWMRPALAAMTAGGHAGPRMSLADLLAQHRARLADGVRALGADPAALVRHEGADDAALLRLAHEEAERAAKTADLPAPRGAGRLGTWIDGFVRLRRLEGDATAVARVRREAALLPDKQHVAAFIAACGADPSMGTGFSRDTVEAGQHLAPLAKTVLAATGPAYVTALAAYLRETGSGETVS